MRQLQKPKFWRCSVLPKRLGYVEIGPHLSRFQIPPDQVVVFIEGNICFWALFRIGGFLIHPQCRKRKITFGGINMSQTYTAVVKQDGGWWIGWIEEVPGVNCQESTREELLKSLRITLSEALEMNRADARDAAGHGYEEHSIAL